MTLQMKRLRKKVWEEVPVSELNYKTPINFIAESFDPVIAVVYEGDRQLMFISNSQKHVDKCSERGLSFLADDLQILLGTQLFPQVIANAVSEFGGTLFEIERLNDTRLTA